MEFINNFGPIGKHMYNSNVASFRYLNYYFDEHLTETHLNNNIHLMVHATDTIADNVTCLLINIKISVERLHQIICNTGIKSVVFFKDAFVENITTSVVCKNIKSITCYNLISMNMINRFFPNVHSIHLFRQNETMNGKRLDTPILPEYHFEMLEELHIYSSGSIFKLFAPNLERFSIYSAYDPWKIDVAIYPRLHTLRCDENTTILNLKAQRRDWRVLQFYPSLQRRVIENRVGTTTTTTTTASTATNTEILDLTALKIHDLILPPNRPYVYKLKKKSTILAIYVNDEDFFKNSLNIDIVGIQVLDNLYPLKMCNLRFSNAFYKYFPHPTDITNELLDRFNIQKQRENLLMIFNFDFMKTFNNANNPWQSWYKLCIETYHRIPIIIQHGQLLLVDGTTASVAEGGSGGGGAATPVTESKEKKWPNVVNKIRKETVIFLPEEELLYINCSPLRLQLLVTKIQEYRRQNFIINKLWLVTNGFEINTKDIEDRIENITIVHNEVKMYISF